MGQNPYPIEIQAGDDKGPVVFGGDATFTDPDNQPGGGGGLPTGWTVDDPTTGDLSANGGGLFMEDGTIDLANGEIDATDSTFTAAFAAQGVQFGDSDSGASGNYSQFGAISKPASGAAFTADAGAGATVALDAGGLDISNAGDVDGATLGPTFDYVTVQAAPPTTYLTPLVQDTTAVSGGVYAWDGSAYQKISSV